jgi:hypothetical protein
MEPDWRKIMLIRAIVQELIEAVIKAEGEGGDYVHMQ